MTVMGTMNWMKNQRLVSPLKKSWRIWTYGIGGGKQMHLWLFRFYGLGNKLCCFSSLLNANQQRVDAMRHDLERFEIGIKAQMVKPGKRECYDLVILSSYGLLFYFNATHVLPPSLFFVIVHSAIHTFLVSWLVVYVTHSIYLSPCTCISADSRTYISVDTCISIDS